MRNYDFAIHLDNFFPRGTSLSVFNSISPASTGGYGGDFRNYSAEVVMLELRTLSASGGLSNPVSFV